MEKEPSKARPSPTTKPPPIFKVTVGKYYTVSGKTPQIRGVKADIVVPGPYDFEHIGEQYLEYSLPNDTIKPEYKDDLADVDPGLKGLVFALLPAHLATQDNLSGATCCQH